MQKRMLRKGMALVGIRTITPEMVGAFTLGEKIAAGMGGYFSLRGATFSAISFIGFPIFLEGTIDSFTPRETLYDLDQIAKLEHNNPVDVKIHVDFEEGAKVWTVKSRYFVTPVKGYEGKIYYCRRQSHLEGEGVNEPVHVRGWAGKWKRDSWDVPALTRHSNKRLLDAGMDIPSDAEILYDTKKPEGDQLNKWIMTLIAIITLAVIWGFLNRGFRTIAALSNPARMANLLNRRLGLTD